MACCAEPCCAVQGVLWRHVALSSWAACFAAAPLLHLLPRCALLTTGSPNQLFCLLPNLPPAHPDVPVIFNSLGSGKSASLLNTVIIGAVNVVSGS